MEILRHDFDYDSFMEAPADPDRPALLMLDYDGTLAPFVQKRDEAVPYEGVRERVHEIAVTPGNRVVIISGRPTAEVQALLGLPESPIEYWGAHGWERLLPNGVTESYPLGNAEREHLTDAALQATSAIGSDEDALEIKPTSVAVHWRGLPEEDARQRREMIEQIWRPLTAGAELELHTFDGGIELRAQGRNKGDAVRTLLSDAPPETVVAYLGDDQTDEDAFQALRELPRFTHRACVLVRPELRDSAADLWLHPPDELLQWLDRWMERTRHDGS
ncbi:trehalose-phosphatase [bacterium]|nr:trehalose-phosphatase [bacterium]